ncbi:MAG: sulfite exporter TauE/SafE family protein [Betaproteobacteria bacterium]|nr:sulfite exporter TauE/SafE family protein [Betaproteobacteria bacterium]
MTIPFDLPTFAIAAAVVAAAYVVFGISAFGAALFTVPVLSHFLPLDFVLPMCTLLDVSAALALGVRFSRESDKSELKLMVPACLIGAVLGVTLLVNLPRQAVIAAFGVFLLAYGLYSLKQGGTVKMIGQGWAPVAGFTGGALGTLFGIGAPPYAIYLSRRMPGKLAFRATLSNMVIFSVSIRALVFTASGLMLADRLAGFAVLLPFALAGLWLGNRIHGRISREAVLRVVAAVLLLIGVSLIVRALAGG